MDLLPLALTVTGIFFITLVLNLFFGHFRARARKYSLKWFLYIHLPIPVIVAARVYFGLGYRVIPLFVVAAVAGQFLGGKLEL
jgi:hypothetical protein